MFSAKPKLPETQTNYKLVMKRVEEINKQDFRSLLDQLDGSNQLERLRKSVYSELPFGGVRTNIASGPIVQTDYGYTGQRNLDEDIGLMDYKARFYSPVLNRFIQPDSIVPGMFNPQNLNRYSYVKNNPIKYSDPSGHFACGGICIAVIAGVLIYGALFITAAINNPESFTSEPTATSSTTPTPTRTPTLNPTLRSWLTASPTGLPTPYPVRIVQGPTSTATPKPLPTSIDPLVIINSEIDNIDPFAPGLSDVLVCPPRSPCNLLLALEQAWNRTALGLKFLKENLADISYDSNNEVCPIVPGAISWPYYSPTPTVTSPATMTQPNTPVQTPTVTPTPFFRTPTATPY